MLIALLTDFGTKDYFVGAMKGVILTISKTVRIVDISHEIEPHNIRSAGFSLRACFDDFPKQTIFVSVVDPGVGSDRKAILVEAGEYFFVAPDNGLLSFIFNSKLPFRVFELTEGKFFNRKKSDTFHGRDIFAPVAAHLANGAGPSEFGREIFDFVVFEENLPGRIDGETVAAEIIHIDRFGNLITNLKREDLPEKFVIQTGAERIEKLYEYFAEAEENEIFTIFGSTGFLEIAVRNNSAARMLKISTGAAISAKIKL